MTTSPTGSQPHLHVRAEEVGRFVFLPGDPARAELIAQRFADSTLVANHREFVTWTGRLAGEAVSVTSTGIGGPSAAIAVEELVKAGADTFIRVGTSGAMQSDIDTPTLGVLHAAIRDEGTSLHYLPVEFPAVAHPDVTAALRRAAAHTKLPVRVGIAQSKDSYYGQHERDRMPVSSALAERWNAWVLGGAICSEMEAAAIFIVAASLGVRAGAVVTVQPLKDGRPYVGAAEPPLEELIDVAVEAMIELMERPLVDN